MERFVEDLLARQKKDLAALKEERNPILRYGQIVKRVEQDIDELKEWRSGHPFNGKTEEIHFFRHLAPQIYSGLFYFMKLLQVESYRPTASRERFREVLDEELKGVEAFFVSHVEFSRYYHQYVSYWDDYLFTQRGSGEWAKEEPGLYIEGDFTIGTYWVSWMTTNEQYRKWLEEQLETMDRPRMIPQELPRLDWTAKLIDLVELVHGLHKAKCFNNGNASLGDIASALELVTGVEIRGRVHNGLQEIRMRKRGRRARFLAEATESLEKDLDARD